MKEKNRFIHRDLSWLSFNYRILEEARDPTVLLYDKIKFLAIWSSNLDEFFRVRVAAMQGLKKIRTKKIKKELAFKPGKIIKKVLNTVEKQQIEYGSILTKEILPSLRENGIILLWNKPLNQTQKKQLDNYFRSRVLSYLQPVFIEESRKKALFLEDKALYLVVKLIRIGEDDQHRPQYAYLNIPSGQLPRFSHLLFRARHYFIFLDDLIRANLNIVFPGYEVISCYSIKLNRNADLNIEDEFSGDLVSKIRNHLKNRKIGAPSRFLYDKKMPEDILDVLIQSFNLGSFHIIKGGVYHNLNDLFSLPDPFNGSLREKKRKALPIPELEATDSLFRLIEKKDYMLHFPYQSYDYVLRFFNEAAIDPFVRTIKVTLYRIAENSLIANALISAARNGKKVIVFVEIKARFDEENNLLWANKMKEAGIKIIYSMPGLKVHAKTALIKRKEESGKIRLYGFLSTGNFNEVTAGIYADDGLFTAHNSLLKEIDTVFTFLEKKKKIKKLKHLLVSQFNIIETFIGLIDQEITHAKNGDPAFITIKINNLEDREMIDKLYEASSQGVTVRLIIRGICCLRPGINGLSDHIAVRRIVDSYLEHSRIFIFHNKGKEKIYAGSADWMSRNLRDRIEVIFPVYNEELQKEIKTLIDLQWSDTIKARILDHKLNNLPVTNHGESPGIRAQTEFQTYLQEKYN